MTFLGCSIVLLYELTMEELHVSMERSVHSWRSCSPNIYIEVVALKIVDMTIFFGVVGPTNEQRLPRCSKMIYEDRGRKFSQSKGREI